MSSTPIAEELGRNPEYTGSERERHNALTDQRYLLEAGDPRNDQSAGRIDGNPFLPEIVDAQQRLISAQHQFLHDNDMQALARAQLGLISAQNDVMHRMGVFG